MLTVFIPLIILCCFVAYCMSKHFAHTKEFNPLWFDLDPELWEAEKRAVKPLFTPYKPPFAHKAMWVIDWIVSFAVAGAIVWAVYNLF